MHTLCHPNDPQTGTDKNGINISFPKTWKSLRMTKKFHFFRNLIHETKLVLKSAILDMILSFDSAKMGKIMMGKRKIVKKMYKHMLIDGTSTTETIGQE